MGLINLTEENIDNEHICCALSSRSSEEGVKAKKDWLKCRMVEGLVFKRLDSRGKVLIEYLPAENAWVPIDAEGFMFINCFWVAGSAKGKGYGKELLEECEKDAQNKGYKGITLIVGGKKKGYLSDKKFMEKHGYQVCDTCPHDFELIAKCFDGNKKDLPKFKNSAKQMRLGDAIKGIDIFYTAQCPFTVPYTKLLEPIIMASDYPVRISQIKTKQEAQNHICPTTTYNVFVNGEFLTHEILTPAKLEKLIAKYTEK